MLKTILTLSFLATISVAQAQTAAPQQFNCDVNKPDDCLTNARSAVTSALAKLQELNTAKALKDRASTSDDRAQIRENILRACRGDMRVCRDFARQTIAYLTDVDTKSLPNLEAIKKTYASAPSASKVPASNPLSLDRFRQKMPIKQPAVTAKGGAAIGSTTARGSASAAGRN